MKFVTMPTKSEYFSIIAQSIVKLLSLDARLLVAHCLFEKNSLFTKLLFLSNQQFDQLIQQKKEIAGNFLKIYFEGAIFHYELFSTAKKNIFRKITH